ncbi:hypothetical protein [Streptomyces sp. NBC_01264]|uniref:hypothetical protein n=1 Tax=Streptomyces sp. NBC_01264 TaxID=2903804 RepID=UPI00224DB06D|nr:hypothetical protein [Streptomyces sp. NBC_01264]MCX4780318.1 hypothetical protein [Streptomyces sp. NBC_01264]
MPDPAGPRPLSYEGDEKYSKLNPLDGYFATCTDWHVAYQSQDQWAVAALFLKFNGQWPDYPEDKLIDEYAAELDRACAKARMSDDPKGEPLLKYAEDVLKASKYRYHPAGTA